VSTLYEDKCLVTAANPELNLASQFLEDRIRVEHVFSYGKRNGYDSAREPDALECVCESSGLFEAVAVVVPEPVRRSTTSLVAVGVKTPPT
jgi:hypothetical protein